MDHSSLQTSSASLGVGHHVVGCRLCGAQTREVLDLGESPPANSLKSSPGDQQASYPLVVEWCQTCGNVQLRDTVSPESLYRDYVYVTPRSTMLDDHYRLLTSYLLGRGYLSGGSFVIEAGSNAGHYLEQIRPSVRRVLGVDPAEAIGALATAGGIPTITDFFDPASAETIVRREGHADVVVARHCLAHNPSPHPMVEAAAIALDGKGYFVVENAYVLNTVDNGEFDQIYHEHMFYFSIQSMSALLAKHDMHIVDVQMSLVHGGSIIFVAAPGRGGESTDAVERYAARERQFLTLDAFANFADRALTTKRQLWDLVLALVDSGKTVYTYGATAKGNTLLNFVGLNSEQIPRCVDNTPMKLGRFLPKSNIEIISEEEGAADPPDYYLLTAWNYRDEIIAKVRGSGNFGSKFIIPIPFVQIV